MNLEMIRGTPPKTNIDTQNDGLEKTIFGICVRFMGCNA